MFKLSTCVVGKNILTYLHIVCGINICPWGTARPESTVSRRRVPLIPFLTRWFILDFLGDGDPGVFHNVDCAMVSGVYRLIPVLSTVAILSVNCSLHNRTSSEAVHNFFSVAFRYALCRYATHV